VGVLQFWINGAVAAAAGDACYTFVMCAAVTHAHWSYCRHHHHHQCPRTPPIPPPHLQSAPLTSATCLRCALNIIRNIYNIHNINNIYNINNKNNLNSIIKIKLQYCNLLLCVWLLCAAEDAGFHLCNIALQVSPAVATLASLALLKIKSALRCC